MYPPAVLLPLPRPRGPEAWAGLWVEARKAPRLPGVFTRPRPLLEPEEPGTADKLYHSAAFLCSMNFKEAGPGRLGREAFGEPEFSGGMAPLGRTRGKPRREKR